MKAFQTDGPCSAQDHYMADLSAKAEKAIEGIDHGDYLIISVPLSPERPRFFPL